MKLSIVIPVYRVEATLNRCLESVTAQAFTDYELILVDDGSPDACPQLCDRWAQKEVRIRVIHQPNRGLSAARNAGIAKAQGEYITFIDSDDYLEPDTLAPLMAWLEQHPTTDILEYPAMLFCGSPRQCRLGFSQTTTYHDMDDYWYRCRAYEHTYAWNKIYRASLFRSIRFPEGEVFEDASTLCQLLKVTREVTTIDVGCYCYCFNPRGITATADGQALATHLRHHVEKLGETVRRDRLFQEYYMRVLNIQIDVYSLTLQPPLLPLHRVNPSYFRGRTLAKAILVNLLGVNGLCKLIKHLHHG